MSYIFIDHFDPFFFFLLQELFARKRFTQMHNASLSSMKNLIKTAKADTSVARAEVIAALARATSAEEALAKSQTEAASLREKLREAEGKLQVVSSRLGDAIERERGMDSLVVDASAVVRDLAEQVGVITPVGDDGTAGQLRWIVATGSAARHAVPDYLRDGARASAEMVFTCLTGCDHVTKLVAVDYTAPSGRALSEACGAVRGYSRAFLTRVWDVHGVSYLGALRRSQVVAESSSSLPGGHGDLYYCVGVFWQACLACTGVRLACGILLYVLWCTKVVMLLMSALGCSLDAFFSLLASIIVSRYVGMST